MSNRKYPGVTGPYITLADARRRERGAFWEGWAIGAVCSVLGIVGAAVLKACGFM